MDNFCGREEAAHVVCYVKMQSIGRHVIVVCTKKREALLGSIFIKLWESQKKSERMECCLQQNFGIKTEEEAYQESEPRKVEK